MKIKWIGHSCFLLTSKDGLKIITDPYTAGGNIRYAPINESADIVTVSHEHRDHNDVSSVKGNPKVVKGEGEQAVAGIELRGIASYHDESSGKERGDNVIFCFTIDKIKVCHLGDLGHKIDSKQLGEIGQVDILFIPVGGNFTIDAEVATMVCDDIKPKIIVPMHFKTPKLEFPIVGVDDFLKGKTRVRKIDSSEIEIESQNLPDDMEIMVLISAS